jgi:hypothetical protein
MAAPLLTGNIFLIITYIIGAIKIISKEYLNIHTEKASIVMAAR